MKVVYLRGMFNVIGSFIVVLFFFGFAWYANAMVNRMLDDFYNAMVNRMLDDFYDDEFNRKLNEFNDNEK